MTRDTPLARRIEFAVRGDDRGNLVAIEGGHDVPFRIELFYYLFSTRPGVVRGCHAHRRLRQAAVAVSGRCVMTFDDGSRRETVVLEDPSQAVLIEPMIWHEMRDFDPGTVLLVVADDHFEEADFIRSYDTFLEMTADKRG